MGSFLKIYADTVLILYISNQVILQILAIRAIIFPVFLIYLVVMLLYSHYNNCYIQCAA